VFVLQTNPETTGYAEALQVAEEPEAQLRALAGALSISPLWKEMSRAVLVVRMEPNPLLGVVGYFDAAGRARLEWLRRLLDRALPHMRYVGYAQAEKDCERLAARLVERFGRDELRNFRFTAIPRGGFIVLGMLAYVLGLRRSQLESPHPPEAPLVVVDDCALSGVRFGRFLERSESRRIVFAHLYSPPELRDAIEAGKPRSVTCVSAHDLQDYAPEYQGDEYSAWRKRWMARMDPYGYWVGQTEHVCFAWNEPDSSIWNPVTNREETGWRFVPPELCLKNRPAPGAKPIPVQVQPRGKGPLKPSSHVLFGELEGQIVVGDLKVEESFMLSDVGADMWQAVVKYGNLEDVAETLLKDYDVDSVALQADLRDFVDDLLCRGLLESEG
jgi:hypothetical protein